MTVTHPDYESLQQCRNMIEAKLGWPPVSDWRDFEFIELSEKIFESTSVQLSTTTLKRLFGKVRYDNLPSSATLNTLAKYLGYEHWMEFKKMHFPKPGKKIVTPASSSRWKLMITRRPAIIMLAALATLISMLGFVFLSGSSSSAVSPRNLIFTSKPLATGLPNSVVFKTNFEGLESDDTYIQQSWDSTRTVKLNPGQTEATGIYYIPGYFRAKLIVNKKILKEHDLFIRSEGWMATIDKPVIPEYIRKNDLQTNGQLTVSNRVLEKIKKLDQPLMLTYHLVQPFEDLHSDHFILTTRFQNTYSEGPAVCKTVKLFILCTNGAFIIPFTIPGCVSDINLKLNDRYFEGKSNDLSVFGSDPSQPMNVRVEVINRETRIFLNDKLLRVEKYHADAGEIIGLRYSFSGAGSIDEIQFQNGAGKIVYHESFEGGKQN